MKLSAAHVLAVAMVLAICPIAEATPSMRVSLDRTSFGSAYTVLQPMANKVAEYVDQLIPGKDASPSSEEIICYERPNEWGKRNSSPPPITLIGPLLNGEASGVRSYTTRIVLSEQVIESPSVIYAGDLNEFVYELAHELTHVKMDARFDSYLMETFAVAVALQALDHFQMSAARQRYIDHYVDKLPKAPRDAIRRNDVQFETRYWQDQIALQKRMEHGAPIVSPWDFSFATLGALILHSAKQPQWTKLLNIAESADSCVLLNGQPTENSSREFKTCRPSIDRLSRIHPALRALGYR